MIRAVHIARFRGIRECVADGLGRVNLIIGKNDCGKTAFMEALQLAEDPSDAAYRLLGIQERRLSRGVKRHDFERFWRPFFFDLDANAGFEIEITRQGSTFLERFKVRQSGISEQTILDVPDGVSIHDDDDYGDSIKRLTWALDLQSITSARDPVKQRVVATPSGGLKLPPVSNAREHGSSWIRSSPGISEFDVRSVSALKERAQDGELVELLREVDPRLSGIELLSPGGNIAELFVRLDNGTPMLPVALMGDGFQRCLELGSSAAAHDWPTLFVDEIENGMHHLVLELLWRWIATVSRRRDLQVFATTHSQECIDAASHAFQSLSDDGLRVIRLDRLKGETRATIYDRALVETAERTGIEIRG